MLDFALSYVKLLLIHVKFEGIIYQQIVDKYFIIVRIPMGKHSEFIFILLWEAVCVWPSQI